MATLVNIRALNRGTRIRVPDSDGNQRTLSSSSSVTVDLDSAATRKALSSHSAVGQWTIVGTSTGAGDASGIMPSGSAHQWMDSWGVNVHLYFTATPDNAYEDHTAVRDALVDLKVRHIRDTYFNSTTQRTRLKALWNDLGIRFQGIFDSRIDSHVSADQSLNILSQQNAIECSGIEGPNEPDIQAFWGADLATRMTAAKNYLISLFNAKDTRTSLIHVPIVTPSTADPTARAQMGDLSAYASYANIHSYPGGYKPRANEKGSNQSLKGEIGHARTNIPSGNVIATETGYHNNVPQTTGHLATSEAVAGIYGAQLLFEYWRQGVKRTFFYELFDQLEAVSQESRFGLYRYNRSEKPLATYLKRIVALLNDSRPVTLQPLGFNLAINAVDTIRYVLLQKSTGEWFLIVWNDLSIWDPTTGNPVAQSNVPVTLNLRSARNVTVYSPTAQAAAISAAQNTTSHALSVPPAAPLIIKISGGQGS